MTSAIEIRLAALYWYTDSRNDGAIDKSNRFGGAVQALYRVPLPLGTAFYAGFGVGGFDSSISQTSGSASVGGFTGFTPLAPPVTVKGTNVGGLGQCWSVCSLPLGRHAVLSAGARGDLFVGHLSYDDLPSSSNTSVVRGHIFFESALGIMF